MLLRSELTPQEQGQCSSGALAPEEPGLVLLRSPLRVGAPQELGGPLVRSGHLPPPPWRGMFCTYTSFRTNLKYRNFSAKKILCGIAPTPPGNLNTYPYAPQPRAPKRHMRLTPVPSEMPTGMLLNVCLGIPHPKHFTSHLGLLVRKNPKTMASSCKTIKNKSAHANNPQCNAYTHPHKGDQVTEAWGDQQCPGSG